MDKFEYKVRAQEIRDLIAQRDYVQAAEIADTIDWRRVKSVMMLCTISDVYKINRRYEDARDLLLLAYEHRPGGRNICYSLCELSIKTGEFVQATEYYKEFIQVAPKDPGRYILQYRLYEDQDVSLEERIAVLEELKKHDYREKWAYELAYLYHRVGLAARCVEECDEMILWFGEGEYVIKAMELKMLHQPLSPEQQVKYDLRFEVKQETQDPAESEEQYGDYSAEYSENYYEEDIEQGAVYATDEADGNTQIYDPAQIERAMRGALEGQKKDPDELDIQVKTVDVGQYNTMNLQAELAQGLREILNAEQEAKGIENPVTQSIMAPMMHSDEEPEEIGQDTFEEDSEEIRQNAFDEELTDVQQDASEEEPGDVRQDASGEEAAEEEPEDSEVFFGETGEIGDIVLEQMRREGLDRAAGQKASEDNDKAAYGAAAGRTSNEESGTTVEKEAAQQTAAEEDTVPQSPEAQSTRQDRETTLPPQVKQVVYPERKMEEVEPPRELAHVLSQETDGQISLVVPEWEKVEKQITGQMDIGDVLAEWERMKKENEEKRKEEVRQHVLQHTGNMFADFDEAVKNGLLEQLEKGSGQPESAQTELDGQEEPAETTQEESGEVEEYDETTAEDSGSDFDGIEQTEEESTEVTEESCAEESEEEALQTPEPEEEAEPEAGETEAEFSAAEEATTEESVAEKSAADPSAAEESASEEEEHTEKSKVRSMTREERELYGPYIQSRSTKEQIVKAVDNISLAAYTGNVIITGEPGVDTISLAKNIIREVQATDSNFSGKVAKISGKGLNGKNVEDTLNQLQNGALIIQNACDMEEHTVQDLYKTLQKESLGIVVLIQDETRVMNRFLKKYEMILDVFTARVDVEALSNDLLVAYGKKYAKEQEYSIDELGVLALHNRIEQRQTIDHAVTTSEVKEIVDGAIRHANRKTPRHFFDILLAKRYDEEDMIVVTEKDFA